MANIALNSQIKELPKICAIDLDPAIVEAIKAKGLHCIPGTLGSQVKIPNLRRYDNHPCLTNHAFPPNFHEYDIVILDLQEREPIEYIESDHNRQLCRGTKKTVMLSWHPETIFDPRPLSLKLLSERLKDFCSKETIIIVFCSAEVNSEYHFATVTSEGNYEEETPIVNSLYEYFPFPLERSNKTGIETIVSGIDENMKNFLLKYNKHFIYEIIFQHPTKYSRDEKKRVERDYFIPSLLNSRNEIIGFVDNSLGESTVLAFPQLQDKKKDFLLELIDEVLPGFFPNVFPFSEQFSWLKSEDYLLPNQTNLLAEKVKIDNDYTLSLIKNEEEITENQTKYQFLHDLITETGTSLVKSLEYFFKWLEFESVINMDEIHSEIKEEDLQINLDSGLLVIEVKGIGGTSKDSECSQINKVKNRRAKERNCFDVYALYIVNHQRYIPPHERKNPPFSDHQIADAIDDERGLLTTYELFKLYAYIKDDFLTKADARRFLLKSGLVQFQPSNSIELGLPLEIHHNGQIAILNISNITLNKGASIIVCNDQAWFRAKILGIRLNDVEVESVSEGEIGVKLSHKILKTSNLWLEIY
jgi:hypothetical protein